MTNPEKPNPTVDQVTDKIEAILFASEIKSTSSAEGTIKHVNPTDIRMLLPDLPELYEFRIRPPDIDDYSNRFWRRVFNKILTSKDAVLSDDFKIISRRSEKEKGFGMDCQYLSVSDTQYSGAVISDKSNIFTIPDDGSIYRIGVYQSIDIHVTGLYSCVFVPSMHLLQLGSRTSYQEYLGGVVASEEFDNELNKLNEMLELFVAS